MSKEEEPYTNAKRFNVGIVSYLNVEWPSGEDMGIESGKVAEM